MDLWFIHPTFLPNVGGVDIAVYALGKELVPMGWSVAVLSRTEMGIPTHYETGGIRVERRDSFPLYHSCMLPLFTKELKKITESCDILQYENPNIWSLAAVQVRAPITLLRYFDFHPADVASLVLTSGVFDAIICPTHHAKKELEALGVADRIEVISTGVDTTLFAPEGGSSLRESLNCPEKKVILLPARIDPHKGIDSLLEAVSLLSHDIVLYITGGGESWKGLSQTLLKKYIKKAAQLNISHKVIFGDGHSWEEMPSIYRGADIVVLTSTYESLGLALMEAMACGKPVVGPDIPAVAEYIKSGINGILIEPQNPESIAEGIDQLLSDPDKANRIAAEGTRTIGQRYSLERTVRTYVTLVDTLK
ncbi:MAG: glycosyltransferase family 4 protein [Candidatus Methanofastidiosia archaeon]